MYVIRFISCHLRLWRVVSVKPVILVISENNELLWLVKVKLSMAMFQFDVTNTKAPLLHFFDSQNVTELENMLCMPQGSCFH